MRKELLYLVFLVIMAGAYIIVSVISSGYRGLNIDEVYQLDFCMHHGFVEVLTLDPYACPLFTAIAWVWYRIVPYGDLALRILPIVFAAGSLMLASGAARTLGGRRTGLVAALLLFVNAHLLCGGALNFRPYALYVLLAAWVLYLYMRRLAVIAAGDKSTWPNAIFMGIAMALLAYTHYLGIVFCFILFVFDLILLVSGKVKGSRRRIFSSYAIAVVLYIPWIAVALKSFMTHVAPAVETAGDEQAAGELDTSVVRNIGKSGDDLDINGMFAYLCGSTYAAAVFGVVSVAIALLVIYKVVKHEFSLSNGFGLLVLLALAHCMIAPFYFLATQTDVITTFWTDRYFMPLMVVIAVSEAALLAHIIKMLPNWGWLHAALALLLVVPIGCYGVKEYCETLDNGNAAMYEPFANYLISQPDIQDDETAWLTLSASKNRGREISVWMEYIFNANGRRDIDINVIDGCDVEVRADPDCIRPYKVLYVSINSNNFNYPFLAKEFRKILREEYTLVETYRPYPETHPREYVRTYVRNDVYKED